MPQLSQSAPGRHGRGHLITCTSVTNLYRGGRKAPASQGENTAAPGKNCVMGLVGAGLV